MKKILLTIGAAAMLLGSAGAATPTTRSNKSEVARQLHVFNT